MEDPTADDRISRPSHNLSEVASRDGVNAVVSIAECSQKLLNLVVRVFFVKLFSCGCHLRNFLDPFIDSLSRSLEVEMGSVSNPGERVRDRISELPDVLISHILSFLDTMEAVRTSVLATRWKKQWTHVPILNFDGVSNRCNPVAIDRVLFFRDSSDIQKFTLYLDEDSGRELDFSRIDSWICTAIWRNVVELDLGLYYGDIGRDFELPQSLFTCQTLNILHLQSHFIVNPPTTRCFPSLKKLKIGVPLSDDDSILEKMFMMFSICPVLEELDAELQLDHARACHINISAPELKRHKLNLDIVCIDEELDASNVHINAPKLVNFDLEMNDLSTCLFHINANSEFKAKIALTPVKQSEEQLDEQSDEESDEQSTEDSDGEMEEESEEHFGNGIAILDEISGVKHLSFSSSFSVEGRLPDFEKLTHLELSTCYRFNRWANLIEFLKRSPNLECLVFKQRGNSCQPDEFNPPNLVPVCILSRLKTITLERFEGRKDEMTVVKYLLNYGEVLNKMNIFMKNTSQALPNVDEKALYNEILMFERGSNTCQVEIINAEWKKIITTERKLIGNEWEVKKLKSSILG